MHSLYVLPEAGEHILSRGEEQMPSLPEQSRSEEQRPSKNKNKTTQMRPSHLKTENDHQKKLSSIIFAQR